MLALGADNISLALEKELFGKILNLLSISKKKSYFICVNIL